MKSMKTLFGILAAGVLSGPFLTAQATRPPRLLKDIEPSRGGPYSSDPKGFGFSSSESTPPFTVGSNFFFFSADDGIHGREIWSSMGIPGTTRLMVDALPGRTGSMHRNLAWFNGYLYFDNWDFDHGTEVWRTNGTPAATYLFQDSMPGREEGGFFHPLVEGGYLWFFARTSFSGYTLFRYDGSNAPPVPIRKDGFSGSWTEAVALGGKVFFLARGTGGAQDLWVTDGTTRGTRILFPGGTNPNDRFSRLVPAGGRLYFAYLEPGGWSVWETRGTKAAKVLDLGPRSQAWSPARLGSKILFPGPVDPKGRRDLWILDGPTGKASLLKKFAGRGYFLGYKWRPVRMGNRVYFACIPSGNKGPFEIWRTDGTPAGTVMVTRKGMTLSSPWSDPSPAGNRIFFRGYDPSSGAELWVTDGTDKGTRRVLDIAPGAPSSTPENLTPILGGRLAFSAWSPRTGRELWVSDGTARGTRLLADIHPGFRGIGSDPGSPADFYGRCFFSARETLHGLELWSTDGTPGGTKLFKEFLPGPAGSSPGGMFTLRDKLLFYVARGKSSGVWVSDGTPGGTRRISVLVDSWKPEILVHGKKALFLASDGARGLEPWVTDGTPAGTMLLKDTVPGPGSARGFQAVSAGNRVFFCSGSNGKASLWVSDLTPAGTKLLVKDLRACGNLVALGGKVLFEGAKGSARGREPWISDGTPAGTRQLLDLAPGFQEGRFLEPFVLGGFAYFFGRDGKTVKTGHFGLFRTDGTKGGTVKIGSRDFTLPNPHSGMDSAFLLGGKALFWSSDSAHGWEPWVTDGTAAGTFLLRDLAPGPGPTAPEAFAKLGTRKAAFLVRLPSRERRILVTDGTGRGTSFLPDPQSGKPFQPSGPLCFSGGKLFFAADDGSTGMEPWTWFPGATAQKIGWRTGKAELLGEDPVLGGKFRLTVTGMAPGEAGLLLVGLPASRPLPLGGGAALFLDPPSRPFLGFPLGGGPSLSFRLPGDPALIGARLAAQAVAGPTGTPPFHLDFTGGLALTLGL